MKSRETMTFTVRADSVIKRPAVWFAAMLELEARHRALADWIEQYEHEAEARRLMTVRPLPGDRE